MKKIIIFTTVMILCFAGSATAWFFGDTYAESAKQVLVFEPATMLLLGLGLVGLAGTSRKELFKR